MKEKIKTFINIKLLNGRSDFFELWYTVTYGPR